MQLYYIATTRTGSILGIREYEYKNIEMELYYIATTTGILL